MTTALKVPLLITVELFWFSRVINSCASEERVRYIIAVYLRSTARLVAGRLAAVDGISWLRVRRP